MLADYGRVQSYLTDKHPECISWEEELEEADKKKVAERIKAASSESSSEA